MRTSLAALLLAGLLGTTASAVEQPWKRHIVDNSSRGADGVRLRDANGDGLLDIATGWEQGGVTRLYLNPGPAKAKDQWPAVTVGSTPSAEDAVLVDVDGDGAMDVVSCMEGKTRKVCVHWGPKDAAQQMERSAWKTEAFPAVRDMTMWMFCTPMDIDGKNGIDLIVGGKSGSDQTVANSKIGWLESPADARDLAAWKFHPLADTGWVMSIVPIDMDSDGKLDILYTDRYGPYRSVRWLANPGPGSQQHDPWTATQVGPTQVCKFLDVGDLDGDGLADIVTGENASIYLHRRLDAGGKRWESRTIPMPPNTGNFKAATIVDVDQDGRRDLVITCEHAQKGKHGVFWMSYGNTPTDPNWVYHPISGADGVKHDLCPLVDLDGDGDLDVLTTEEITNLGVIWYENPLK